MNEFQKHLLIVLSVFGIAELCILLSFRQDTPPDFAFIPSCDLSKWHDRYVWDTAVYKIETKTERVVKYRNAVPREFLYPNKWRLETVEDSISYSFSIFKNGKLYKNMGTINPKSINRQPCPPLPSRFYSNN